MTTEQDIDQAMVPFEEGPGAPPRMVELAPREVLAVAKEQAEALMELVKKKPHLSTRMGKSDHLHAEVWITIAAFNNIVAKTKWLRVERDDDEKKTGYEAEVELIHTPTGEIRGGAIMSCGLDAYPCQSKRGTEKDKAAKSAAQTWAAAKAIRMTLSYVPVLAGYSPVPYEEMQASVSQPDERDESAPFCEKHGVSFRKQGGDKRTWYSHPDDSEENGWCNYKKPAQAPDALKADKATWEPFMERVKAGRGDTAKEDLAHIIEGGTSPKVLRAYALEQGYETPGELFERCVAQWAVRDSHALFPDDEDNPNTPDGSDEPDPERSDEAEQPRLAHTPMKED